MSLSLAVAGCEREAAPLVGPIDEATYVVVMSELADLQRFPPAGSDAASREAAADSARLAILERHGVTVDDLLAYAELAGGEPDRMQRISERIVDITDSLAQRRTIRNEDADADSSDASSESIENAGEATGGRDIRRSVPPRRGTAAEAAAKRDAFDQIRRGLAVDTAAADSTP